MGWGRPVVAKKHAIGVDHRDDAEDEVVAEELHGEGMKKEAGRGEHRSPQYKTGVKSVCQKYKPETQLTTKTLTLNSFVHKITKRENQKI